MAGRPKRRARLAALAAEKAKASGEPVEVAEVVPMKRNPPFARGNVHHVTSGYRSPRVYGELASELVAGMLQERPDLAGYPEALANWGQAESVVALLRRHLDKVGVIDPGTDEPRDRLLKRLHAAERAAAQARAAIGLDPLSEAKLARERSSAGLAAVSLQQVAEAGRAALEARELAGLPAPPDLAGEVLERVAAEGRREWDDSLQQWREAHGIDGPYPRHRPDRGDDQHDTDDRDDTDGEGNER